MADEPELPITLHKSKFFSAEGLLYTPFINKSEVGYIVLDPETKRIETIYLRPSTGHDVNPDNPHRGDVFLYHEVIGEDVMVDETFFLMHPEPRQ
jgi:hypothetical protein